MPFGLQPIHLIVIAIVALIIFGPKRLPEIGRGIGRAFTEFRKGAREMSESFREEVTKPANEPTPSQPQQAAPYQPSVQPPVIAQSQTVAEPQPVAQPKAAGGNYCVNCGAPNPQGAKFCNSCGEKMPA
jgi:sec-independent protein translocase protein TatA